MQAHPPGPGYGSPPTGIPDAVSASSAPRDILNPLRGSSNSQPVEATDISQYTADPATESQTWKHVLRFDPSDLRISGKLVPASIENLVEALKVGSESSKPAPANAPLEDVMFALELDDEPQLDTSSSSEEVKPHNLQAHITNITEEGVFDALIKLISTFQPIQTLHLKLETSLLPEQLNALFPALAKANVERLTLEGVLPSTDLVYETVEEQADKTTSWIHVLHTAIEEGLKLTYFDITGTLFSPVTFCGLMHAAYVSDEICEVKFSFEGEHPGNAALYAVSEISSHQEFSFTLSRGFRLPKLTRPKNAGAEASVTPIQSGSVASLSSSFSGPDLTPATPLTEEQFVLAGKLIDRIQGN